MFAPPPSPTFGHGPNRSTATRRRARLSPYRPGSSPKSNTAELCPFSQQVSGRHLMFNTPDGKLYKEAHPKELEFYRAMPLIPFTHRPPRSSHKIARCAEMPQKALSCGCRYAAAAALDSEDVFA